MADNINLTQQYLDAMNEAMRIHAESAVKGLQFNKTETATIVGEQDADGYYPVYNGSIRYMAKSEKTDYKKGATVYVTIPNNDTSLDKYIVGMLRDKDGKGLTYTSPLQKYQPDKDLGNFIELEGWKIDESDDFWTSLMELNGATYLSNYNNSEGTGLVANYNLEKAKFNESERVILYQSKNLQECEINTKNYKYLGVSADFKTLLGGYYPIRGDYGLEIFIQYSYNQEGSQSEKVYQVLTYRLSTQDMIGAVYKFNTFYKQEALFQIENDLAAGTKIHRIGIAFYQDNNFENSDGKINTEYEVNRLKNILVKNLSLEFGDDLPEDTIDSVNIYTTNGQFYDSAQLNEKLNEKRIYLRWQHLDYENEEDNILKEIKNLNDAVSSDADVKLYPKVTWFKDSLHTLADFRAEEAEAVAENDRLYALLKKYKTSIENRDAWITEWTNAYQALQDNETVTMSAQEVGRTYSAIRDKYKTGEDEITRDEMYELINELGLKSSEDYFYNMETQQYYLTPTGEKTLDRKITRNAKSTLSNAVSSEDGGDHWVPIATNTLSVDFTPDEELKREEFNIKCIVEYGPKDKDGNIIKESVHYRKLISNELKFMNLSAVPDPNAMDAAIGVKLTYNDDSNGQYPLYDGQVGKILDNFEYSRERAVVMDFVSKYSGKSYLNGGETIIWKVPRINTMININNFLSDESPNETTTRAVMMEAEEYATKYSIDFDFINYYYVKLECYNSNGIPIYNQLDYQIKEYFTHSAINNTVTCYLIKNNQVFEGYTTMYFYNKGSNGTDYTFTLGFGQLYDENWNVVGPASNVLTIGDPYYREIVFELYDGDGSKINLTDDEKNAIIIKWINNQADGYYSGLFNAIDVLKFNPKYTTYYDGSSPILRATRIAVQAKSGFGWNRYRYITLAASISSSAFTTYNQRTYKHDNVLFTQYLPVQIRTNDIYNIDGNTVIYYDDRGSLDNSGSFTYSLVGYGLKEWKSDYAPDVEGFQEYLKAVDNTIADTTEELINRATSNSIGLYLTLGTITNKQTIQYAKDYYYITEANMTAIKEDGANIVTRINEQIERLKELQQAAVDRMAADKARAEEEGYTYNSDYIVNLINQYEILIEGFTYVSSLEEFRVSYIKRYYYEAQEAYEYYTAGAATFEIFCAKDDGTNLTQNEITSYYPSFQNDSKTLTPPTILVNNLSKCVCIDARLDGTYVYTTPLLLVQNNYQVPALNKWNGKLLVDSENNQIMAATIAAGHKENNNSFTGVIMGDIQKSGENTPVTGLYGYNTGAQTFGFKTDGTAFIGKTGTGRIEFDGKSGIIQSGNYVLTKNGEETSKEGSRFNLNSGDIDLYGYGKTYSYTDNKFVAGGAGGSPVSTHVHIGTMSDTSSIDGITRVPSYFSIAVPSTNGNDSQYRDFNDGGRKPLIKISQSEYFLQTADYNGSTNGLRIDLKNGTFDSKGTLTINGGANSKIHFGSNNDYLELGVRSNGNGYLSSTGDLQITGNSNSYIVFGEKVNIRGSGNSTIAGWRINEDSFSGGNMFINANGSMSGSNWSIDTDGNGWFTNSFRAGQATTWNGGVTGFGYNGGSCWFNGDIYANNGYFKGEIVSAKGKIGGWTINESTLSSGSTILNSNGTIEGAFIKGGSIDIGNGSFKVNRGGTRYAYVSGLNVGDGGLSAIGIESTTNVKCSGRFFCDGHQGCTGNYSVSNLISGIDYSSPGFSWSEGSLTPSISGGSVSITERKEIVIEVHGGIVTDIHVNTY